MQRIFAGYFPAEVLTTLAFRRIPNPGAAIAPAILSVLAACGGSSNGGNPGVLPTPIATASPTPNPNPTASGDEFAYAGSMTQTFTIYGTPAPLPSASAAPMPTSTPWISTISQNVTQNVSVATGQSLSAQTGLTELTTKETDASQVKTTSVTSQTYLSYAHDSTRVNGVNVTEVGTSSTDSNGVKFQSLIGTGNGIVDKLPNVIGAQWSNNATRTDTENDPSGEIISTTYAADGSYQEQMTYPEGGSNGLAQANGDGSGVFQLPMVGAPGGTNSEFTVNAPAGDQIQISYSLFVGTPVPLTGAGEISDWYPQTPPVLASDTYVDEGATTLPSSCNAATAYQSVSVEKIVETKNRLDTLFGDYETGQVTQYASSVYGLLCVVVKDDLKTYYDFSGQSQGLIALSPTPMRDTAVTETLALQSEQVVSTSSSAAHFLPQPSLARVRMILATAHAQNIRAMYTRAHSAFGTRKSR